MQQMSFSRSQWRRVSGVNSLFATRKGEVKDGSEQGLEEGKRYESTHGRVLEGLNIIEDGKTEAVCEGTVDTLQGTCTCKGM